MICTSLTVIYRYSDHFSATVSHTYLYLDYIEWVSIVCLKHIIYSFVAYSLKNCIADYISKGSCFYFKCFDSLYKRYQNKLKPRSHMWSMPELMSNEWKIVHSFNISSLCVVRTYQFNLRSLLVVIRRHATACVPANAKFTGPIKFTFGRTHIINNLCVLYLLCIRSKSILCKLYIRWHSF